MKKFIVNKKYFTIRFFFILNTQIKNYSPVDYFFNELIYFFSILGTAMKGLKSLLKSLNQSRKIASLFKL